MRGSGDARQAAVQCSKGTDVRWARGRMGSTRRGQAPFLAHRLRVCCGIALRSVCSCHSASFPSCFSMHWDTHARARTRTRMHTHTHEAQPEQHPSGSSGVSAVLGMYTSTSSSDLPSYSTAVHTSMVGGSMLLSLMASSTEKSVDTPCTSASGLRFREANDGSTKLQHAHSAHQPSARTHTHTRRERERERCEGGGILTRCLCPPGSSVAIL